MRALSLLLLLSCPWRVVAPASALPAGAETAPAASALTDDDAEDDVATWLARLADERGETRLAAQRWLGVHLEREHFPDVAVAARAGSAEVDRRLVLALASEDRHLGLSILLASDTDDAVRAVGEAAIAESLARWSSSSEDPPLRARGLPREWEELATTRLSLAREPDDVAALVDRLARLGGGPAPLVVDPSLWAVPPPREPGRRARSAHEGRWGEVLSSITRAHRASFQVHGWRAEGDPGAERARAWVRVCKRGDESEASTLAYVLAWCRGLLRELDPEWNTACALSLAALEWPAAALLLEERWLVDGEQAALLGLLSAAGRGRVAPAIARAGTVRGLLADPLLAAPWRAELLARALASVPPIDALGTPLVPVALAGWESADAQGRWVRLVALEGMGVRDPAAAARAREALGDPRLPPGTRWQAARVLARARAEGETTALSAELPALFEHASECGGAAALAAALGAAGARPPAAVEAAWRSVPARLETRLAWVDWCLAAGDEQGASGAFGDVLDLPGASPDALARFLARGADPARRARLRAMLAALAARSGGARAVLLRELAVRARLATDGERSGFLDERLAALAAVPGDAGALLGIAAAAGAASDGERACEALLSAAAGDAPADALVPAFELALEQLRAARLEEERELLLERLRRAAAGADGALAEAVLARGWPPEPAPDALVLDLADRRP